MCPTAATAGALIVLLGLVAPLVGQLYIEEEHKVHDPCESVVCTTGKDGRRTFCRVVHVCDKPEVDGDCVCNFTLPVCVSRASSDTYYDYQPQKSVCKKGSPVIQLSGDAKLCNGSEDCPMGYQCVDAQYGKPIRPDEEGVCCLEQKKMKKPPKCPIVTPQLYGGSSSFYGNSFYKPIDICMTKCYSDYDCGYGELCCYTGCGYKCIPVQPQKPTTTPQTPTDTTTMTTITTMAPTTAPPAPEVASTGARQGGRGGGGVGVSTVGGATLPVGGGAGAGVSLAGAGGGVFTVGGARLSVGGGSSLPTQFRGGANVPVGGTNVLVGGANVPVGGTNFPVGGGASLPTQFRGGANVPVGGTNVLVGGANVPVGGTNVLVGGANVPVGGTNFPVGGRVSPSTEFRGGTNVPVGGTNVPVGGTNVPVGGGSVPSTGETARFTGSVSVPKFSGIPFKDHPKCPSDPQNVICSQFMCYSDKDCQAGEACCDSKTCKDMGTPGTACVRVAQPKKKKIKKKFPFSNTLSAVPGGYSFPGSFRGEQDTDDSISAVPGGYSFPGSFRGEQDTDDSSDHLFKPPTFRKKKGGVPRSRFPFPSSKPTFGFGKPSFHKASFPTLSNSLYPAPSFHFSNYQKPSKHRNVYDTGLKDHEYHNMDPDSYDDMDSDSYKLDGTSDPDYSPMRAYDDDSKYPVDDGYQFGFA